MGTAIDFGRAIEILEISDINCITDSDWITIRRRAKKRWHPDKILHLKPEPEVVRRYQENFALIEEAITFLKSYIAGDYTTGESTSRQYQQTTHENPEHIIRRNAPEMQETLKKVWGKVKQNRYKFSEEIQVVFSGNLFKDLLKQDLQDDMPFFSISSFFSGWVLVGFLTLIPLFALPKDSSSQKIVLATLICLWIVQAVACILGLLPLSRFWLPQKISDGVIYLINVGIRFLAFADQTGLNRIWIIGLYFSLPVIFARVVQAIIITPLYWIVSLIIGNRTFGKIEQRGKYYAGLADWFIEQLIHGNPANFNKDELFALSHAYAELKDIP